MEGAKTVDHALCVLLALENQPRTASGLAEATGLNRTVVHRMLAALQRRGFVRREEDLYYPGAAFVRFANAVEPALRTASRAAMQDLAAETGETAVLSVRDQLDSVAIEQVVGRRHPLRVEYDLGSRRPIVKGASGRAILAFLEEAVISRALQTVPDPDAHADTLAQVREKGFAMSRDELRAGVHGIAAPVFTQGQVAASLSVIVPAARGEEILGHLDLLLRVVKAIGGKLDAGG